MDLAQSLRSNSSCSGIDQDHRFSSGPWVCAWCSRFLPNRTASLHLPCRRPSHRHQMPRLDQARPVANSAGRLKDIPEATSSPIAVSETRVCTATDRPRALPIQESRASSPRCPTVVRTKDRIRDPDRLFL